MRVVNRYIGVNSGYLGDFSYQSHHDFYVEYCDLEYNPYEYTGTTRERFIAILSAAPGNHQAKILRGVVERFPVDAQDAPTTRTEGLRQQLLQLADRLGALSPIRTPTLKTRSDAVERAVADVEALIASTGAPSAVDRIHTALHGYLEALCAEERIPVRRDADLPAIFSALRQHHSGFQASGPAASDINKVLRSTAAILDAFQPLRNRASGAHPNPQVLDPAEAMLVVNLARSILHYLDMRLT